VRGPVDREGLGGKVAEASRSISRKEKEEGEEEGEEEEGEGGRSRRE
jgi:hypothetical protein